MEILIGACLVIGIILSVRTRKSLMMWRTEQIPSPLSKALTQLVGTAGGIYISLELLLTFLGIPEDVWNPSSIRMIKPLAVLSIAIAIIQPYALKIWLGYKKRRG